MIYENTILNDIFEDAQFIDIMNEDLEVTTEAFWEGHNLSQKARNIKSNCKQAKRLAADGKKTEAKAIYDKALKELNEVKSLAHKMPDDSVWDWVARICTIALPINPAAIPAATVMNLPHIVRYYRAYKAGEDDGKAINKGNALKTIDECISYVKDQMKEL